MEKLSFHPAAAGAATGAAFAAEGIQMLASISRAQSN